MVTAELACHYALLIYSNFMELPNVTPAVSKLLRGQRQLERVARWMEEGVTENDFVVVGITVLFWLWRLDT